MDIVSSVDKFEKAIYIGLMIMLIAVIIAAVADLGIFLSLSLATSNPACWKPTSRLQYMRS